MHLDMLVYPDSGFYELYTTVDALLADVSVCVCVTLYRPIVSITINRVVIYVRLQYERT